MKLLGMAIMLSTLFFVSCSSGAENAQSPPMSQSLEAGDAALRVCFAIKKNDFDFLFDHSERVRRELHKKEIIYPKAEFKKFKKQYRDAFITATKEAKGYVGVYNLLRSAKLSLVESKHMAEDAKPIFNVPAEENAYLVFIHAEFERIEDAFIVTEKNGEDILIKSVTFRVIIIEHSGSYFLNSPWSFSWDPEFRKRWPDEREMRHELLRRKAFTQK
ncbi:MAG: hypothetical protein COU47_02360 [Candidatus Niyogibacteria bacterium CG10_big_fil_rev_8_21_14_0_10_46_36]|uniref:Lipoprotein n=1 Tax=Candidatus Niyogibacteria bacterium CG10_big_fil_rev_8_21_14_0_10_46_36 TaxID=1974726 RepID=A0A2H0TFI7_9BACT|nr:MAG: hypothetical protein COU47_02360 [Candidatus Niyogibacteria bacterium CG10_big_fil_rev_8_21_14_0_10_46_36]